MPIFRQPPFLPYYQQRSLPPSLTAAGIALDAANNSGYQSAAGSYSGSASWNGSNRFLAVDVEILSVPGTTVTAMTYGGAAMTFIGARSTVSGAGRVECWGIAQTDSGAPAAGSNTLSVTLSTSVAFTVTWVSYTGVHQTLPTEAFNSNQATNIGAADATVAVTSIADNCWIHAALASDDASVTANQTPRNNVSGLGGSGVNEDTGPITPAGLQTMSVTGTGAGATWVIAGYAIRPIAASGPTSTLTPNRLLLLSVG